MRRFEAGGYQANEQSEFNSDQETFKALVESARNTDTAEEKEEKRRLAKELIAHGLVDRDLIIEILRSQGADQIVLDEWENKVKAIVDNSSALLKMDIHPDILSIAAKHGLADYPAALLFHSKHEINWFRSF